MNKYLLILVAVATLGLTACNKDSLDDKSVITVDKIDYTPFDYWLNQNFVQPYNLQFKYRFEEIESDLNYYTVPATYENSIILAHLVKYLCLEAYDEVGGINFTRANFPKLIFCIGDWEYKNNGTYILGTAEGGRKILLAGVNFITDHLHSASELNHYYFKTVHHEFTHILNQTKDIPTDFQFITGTGYVADAWSTAEYDKGYLQRGFISAYAQHSYTEDFAEMLSIFVCYPKSQWDAWMEEAGADAAALITAKLDIVTNYMITYWGIDLYQLRQTIQRRQSDVANGKINLTDITVK